MSPTPWPATNIPVKAFHHTLLWPVLMRGPAAGKGEAEQNVDEFVKAFVAAGWAEQVGANNGVHADYTYGEVVYFHPFVRDFLFGDGKAEPKDRAVRRFTRTDATGVTVGIMTGTDQFTTTLKVERAELLLLRPRVAMLLVEVSNRDPQAAGEPTLGPRTPLTLHQALLVQSRLRHLYPPFFIGNSHGDCPAKVEWHGLPPLGLTEKYTPATLPGTFGQFTRVGAEPPVYDHWRQWFGCAVEPLRSAADRTAVGKLYLQQLLDDRLPGLSFLGVDAPDTVSPADLDRLPAFDPPDLSYDPQFTDALRDGFRYTRFRHWGTTYFGNGTSFAMLTSAGGPPFLLDHFRRHYTHLAVIAQFQHAALLYFADELADTAKMLANRKDESEFSDKNWRDRIRTIQHRFLKFRTRSYFTEVSHQIQGKDLFAFWLKHLGTAALFDRVSATNTQVYEALETFEARQMSDAQFWLGKIASFGGAISLGLSVAALLCSVAGLYNNPDREAASFAGTTPVPPWLGFWLVIAAVPAMILALGFGFLSWLGFRKAKKGN